MEPRRFFALLVFAVLPVLGLSMVLAALPGRGPDLEAAALPAVAAFAPAPEKLRLPAAAAPTPESTPDMPAPPLDEALTVRLMRGGTVETLSLAEYLPGVVAGEMPASFHPEALKAQAVAARTDTLYRILAHVHQAADCCDDATCCKAYLDDQALRTLWGADYGDNMAKITDAVSCTDGQILLYEAQPIFAAFHAASPGSTEASENVWLSALPYLRSVESREDAASVPDYYATVFFSYPALRALLEAGVTDAALDPDPTCWLTDPVYTDSGRIQTVTVGGQCVSGTALRRILGLRSAAITWTCAADGAAFTTAGHGHGVGMSQYGAQAMAKDGADWTEILAHYYPGTVLGDFVSP